MASAFLEDVDAAKTINGSKIMTDSAVNSPASSYLPRFEIRLGTQAQGSYDSFKDAMIVAMKLRSIYPAEAITVIDLTSGTAVFDTD